MAQRALGLAYAHGRGVARDPARAVAWLERAAAAGDGEARRALDSLRTARRRGA
ncbi:SEL1-like repeat protein [Massilia oculi]|uniref:SEL1-like repeat protein n=1 Tax=Massilia hydrophila TaxID=3044279 RepID=A0ABS7YDE1_9BURK|nr:SEL1-like repeat protein [Massilia oculi]